MTLEECFEKAGRKFPFMAPGAAESLDLVRAQFAPAIDDAHVLAKLAVHQARRLREALAEGETR